VSDVYKRQHQWQTPMAALLLKFCPLGIDQILSSLSH